MADEVHEDYEKEGARTEMAGWEQDAEEAEEEEEEEEEEKEEEEEPRIKTHILGIQKQFSVVVSCKQDPKNKMPLLLYDFPFIIKMCMPDQQKKCSGSRGGRWRCWGCLAMLAVLAVLALLAVLAMLGVLADRRRARAAEGRPSTP